MAHKVKHRHIKAKHQKKRYFRANDPLWSAFMWGVNQTVSGAFEVTWPSRGGRLISYDCEHVCDPSTVTVQFDW